MANDWDAFIRQYQHVIDLARPGIVAWELKPNAEMMLRIIPVLREQLDLAGLEVVTSHTVLTFWLPWRQQRQPFIKLQVLGQEDGTYRVYFYSVKNSGDVGHKSDETWVAEDHLVSTLQEYLNRLRDTSPG